MNEFELEYEYSYVRFVPPERSTVLFCEQLVPKARIYYLPRVRYSTKIVRR